MGPQEESPPVREKIDGTLLDSALLNLNIAQQYIDESRHLVEHRLICFHYAVAILARYRDPYRKEMIHLARQHLVDATNWNLVDDSRKLRDAHDRIICEAQYNLGVIDELEHKYDSSQEYYDCAAVAAEQKGPDYAGVEILAKFGRISARLKNAKKIGQSREIKFNLRIRTEIELLLDRIERETQSQIGRAPTARAFTATPARPGEHPNFGQWLRKIFASLRKDSETEKEVSPPLATAPTLRANSTLALIEKKLNSFMEELSSDKPNPEGYDPPTDVPESRTDF